MITSPKLKTMFLGGLGIACLLGGCASLPGTSLTASGDGIHDCAEAGAGAPVVVFESGIGEKLNTWDKVYPEVAGFTTAFAYSRRGYGDSSPATRERDGENAVQELRALLATRGFHPPFILVGHSLGGLYVELFAKRYPNEVAGVVLVDPTPVDHMERLRRELPGKYNLARTLMALQTDSVLSAEQSGIEATSRQWHEAGPFPHRPMILLTGVKAGLLEDANMIAYKERAHAELLKLWPGAQHRRIDSGHFIQRDKPEAVVAAVQDVVARVRATQQIR